MATPTGQPERMVIPPATLPASLQKSAGNLAMQRALAPESSEKAKPGEATRTALEGSSGSPLPFDTRASMEGMFNSSLGSVRLHTGSEAARAAQELNANAFTYGQDVFFGEGRYNPSTPAGLRLLAHEVAHTVQQGEAPPSPSMLPPALPAESSLEREAESASQVAGRGQVVAPVGRYAPPSLARDDQKSAPDPAQTTGATTTTTYRNFSIQVIPEEPDLFAVPEDAGREEIANRLLGDPTKTTLFQFMQVGRIPVVDYKPGKAIRVTKTEELTSDALTALRQALDGALDKDVDRTLSILKQHFIGDSDESELVEICLRWSQRSDIKNASGTNYFEAYLQRLKSVNLTETFLGIEGKTRNALEWLIIEAEEKAERIKKAIELRAPAYSVGYTVTDAAPEFAPGDIIGRFFYSKTVDRGSVQIRVLKTLVIETSFARAETATRSSSYTGMRVVVPGGDGKYYGYAVEPVLVDDPLVTRPEMDPEGHYYWYHPGTVFVSTGTFQKDFVKGGEPERKQRTELLTDALSRATAADPSPLYGLDYEVLSVATLDQKIAMTHMMFGGPGSTVIPGRELMVRIIEATPQEDRVALEERLEAEGLMDKLLALSEPGITRVLGARLSEKEKEDVDRLDGLTSTYKKYRLYKTMSTTGGILAGMGTMSPEAAGTSLGMARPTEDLRKEVEAELREQGFASIDDFEKANQRYIEMFGRFAMQKAFSILDENEALIKGEYARYGGDPKGGGIAQLRNEIGPLKTQVEARETARDKLEQAKAALERAKEEKSGEDLGQGEMRYPKEEQAVADAERVYNEEVKKTEKVRGDMAPRFPVLADQRLDLVALVRADDAAMSKLLQSDAMARLADIDQARGYLAQKPSLVWQMEGAIARARVEQGVMEGSIYDLLIKDKLSDIKLDEFFKNLLLAALAIGLGILSAGGGTVAVLASLAGAGISTYQAAEHIQKFAIQQAAAGTAFDRAKALTADDPSFFWLAVDIAAAIFDLAMAAKALSTLKPAAQAAITATDEATKLAKLEQLEKLAQQVEKDAKAAEETSKGAAGVKAAEDVTKVGEKSESLAAKVVESTKKRIAGKEALEKLGKEGEALKALVKGDEGAAGGLARLDAATRAEVLKALEGSSDGLRRLGNMAQESEEVINGLEAVRKAFVEKGGRPDQFKAILEKYILTTNEKSPFIFKALGQAGATEEDLAKMVVEMKGMKAPKNVATEFGSRAIELVAEKLPKGKEGIAKIVDMTKWMEQSSMSSIFEKWARTNVYGDEALGRFISKTDKLPGKYTVAEIRTDSAMVKGEDAIIVEMKNYKTPTAFTEGMKEGKQVVNYQEMIKQGVTYNGKPFRRVEYLFSTKEAADKAAASIKTVLGDNAKIFYIDINTGLKTAL